MIIDISFILRCSEIQSELEYFYAGLSIVRASMIVLMILGLDGSASCHCGLEHVVQGETSTIYIEDDGHFPTVENSSHLSY